MLVVGGGGVVVVVIAHFVQLLSIHRSMMYVQLRLNTTEYHRCGAVDIATTSSMILFSHMRQETWRTKRK
jgi:hypothetical protein